MSTSIDYVQLIGTILSGLLAAAIIYIWRKWTYWDRHGIPSPGPFAQFYAFKGRQAGDVEMEWFNKHGRVYGLYELLTPMLVVGDPENVKKITINDFSKFRNHSILNSIDRRMDLNVFILRDDYWKRMRGIVSPVFSSGKLKVMSESINPCIENFITNVIKSAAASESSVLSMKKYFDCLTMDVIVSFAYGSKIDCLNDPNNEIVLRAAQIFQTIAQSLGIFGSRFVDKSCFDYFSNLTLDLVAQRRKENMAGGEKRGDFLQVLTDAKYNKGGPSLSDDEICAFGLSFFSDGYETTANAMTAVIFYLATNQSIQEKLYQEVNQVTNVTADVVSALPYLDAVVKESYRMWPAAYKTDRMAEEDYKLEGTNFTIPAGMAVQIPLYAMQRDPETFPDPDVFKPERFLPDGDNCDPNPLANLIFGAGPRSCVAQRFATLQIKLTMTKAVKKIKFLATPDTKLENTEGVEFFVFPKDVYVKIQPR